MKKTNIDVEEMQKSFDRTDKIIAFRKELAQLINSHGIDSLLEVPDYILASVAVAQMEICSSMASGITKGHFKSVIMI
jgi:hypothetical protein